jgi:hypothetical protein
LESSCAITCFTASQALQQLCSYQKTESFTAGMQIECVQALQQPSFPAEQLHSSNVKNMCASFAAAKLSS